MCVIELLSCNIIKLQKNTKKILNKVYYRKISFYNIKLYDLIFKILRKNYFQIHQRRNRINNKKKEEEEEAREKNYVKCKS